MPSKRRAARGGPVEGDLPPLRGMGAESPLLAEPLHEAFDGVDLLGLEHLERVGDARVVHMSKYTDERASAPMGIFRGLRGEARGLF